MFERKSPPPEFQERINQVGGFNQYGEPNFLLAWSQSHTFRAGACWPQDHFIGYREVFTATGNPSKKLPGYWMLLEWKAPHCSQSVWNFLNRDEQTGLQNLGPFPSSGSYQVALKLQTQQVINGRLVLEGLPLDSVVIDQLLPLIVSAKSISQEKRLQMAAADRVRAEQKEAANIEKAVHSAQVAFKGSTALSYAGQKNRNSSVAQRMETIERQWNQFLKNYKQVQRGFSQGGFAR